MQIKTDLLLYLILYNQTSINQGATIHGPENTEQTFWALLKTLTVNGRSIQFTYL